MLGFCSRSGPCYLQEGEENLLFQRVKVARDLYKELRQRICLWLDDMCLPIDVELEREEKIEVLNDGTYAATRKIMDYRVLGAKYAEASSCRSSSGSGLEEEDDDVTAGFSNSNSNLPPSQ